MDEKRPRRISVSIHWFWYDLWIGVYVDVARMVVYVCPLPTLVVRIAWLANAMKDEG